MVKEHNFTKIPNIFLEMIVRIHLSDYEHRIILFILRKTYGYHKDSDWIALSQFSKATGIARQNVWDYLNR